MVYDGLRLQTPEMVLDVRESNCIEPQGIHNLVVAAGDVEKAGVDAKVYETVFTRYFVFPDLICGKQFPGRLDPDRSAVRKQSDRCLLYTSNVEDFTAN